MRAVVLGVIQKRKLKVEQLTDVDLATFGHLICGLYPSEIKRLNPYNLRSVKCLIHTDIHHILTFLETVIKLLPVVLQNDFLIALVVSR